MSQPSAGESCRRRRAGAGSWGVVMPPDSQMQLCLRPGHGSTLPAGSALWLACRFYRARGMNISPRTTHCDGLATRILRCLPRPCTCCFLQAGSRHHRRLRTVEGVSVVRGLPRVRQRGCRATCVFPDADDSHNYCGSRSDTPRGCSAWQAIPHANFARNTLSNNIFSVALFCAASTPTDACLRAGTGR